MSLLTKLFNFVLLTSAKYNIDESHGLSHSMDVLYNAHKIYESEVPLKLLVLGNIRVSKRESAIKLFDLLVTDHQPLHLSFIGE